jgi:hypothetical protein
VEAWCGRHAILRWCWDGSRRLKSAPFPNLLFLSSSHWAANSHFKTGTCFTKWLKPLASCCCHVALPFLTDMAVDCQAFLSSKSTALPLFTRSYREQEHELIRPGTSFPPICSCQVFIKVRKFYLMV